MRTVLGVLGVTLAFGLAGGCSSSTPAQDPEVSAALRAYEDLLHELIQLLDEQTYALNTIRDEESIDPALAQLTQIAAKMDALATKEKALAELLAARSQGGDAGKDPLAQNRAGKQAIDRKHADRLQAALDRRRQELARLPFATSTRIMLYLRDPPELNE